jgi:cellulase/cellobiase CelA1
MGNLNVGHGGTYDQANGGEFGRVAVLYLKWRLKDDTAAGTTFVGASCGLCGTQWTVQQKNLTLDGGTPPSTPPAGCTAAYAVQDQWNGGFVATVSVTAGSSAINGWRITLTLPGGAAISQVWNAVATGTSGTVTAANQSYNGRLAAGQSAAFGLQGTGSGAGATVTCTGS